MPDITVRSDDLHQAGERVYLGLSGLKGRPLITQSHGPQLTATSGGRGTLAKADNFSQYGNAA